MPIYQHECPHCNPKFEPTRTFGNKVAACTACDASARQLFMPVSVLFEEPDFNLSDS